MAEISRPWDGVATGDATESPYDAGTEFARIMGSISGSFAQTNKSAVCKGEDNELAVTGVASPISVDTGSAIVWGTWYNNSAAVTVVIPTPAGATRVDRVVLRKDWAAQTIRITRIAGVEGGVAPALTQSEGVTWDQPLASCSITTGGVITVTDEREYINNAALVDHTHTGGADLSPIPLGGIVDGILANSAAGRLKMADGFLSADAGGRAKMANGFILDAQVNASAAIAATKINFGTGFRAERHPYANDRHIESGVSAGDSSITFTNAYAVAPAFICHCRTFGGDFDAEAVSAVNTTGATITNSAGSGNVDWIAEGQD